MNKLIIEMMSSNTKILLVDDDKDIALSFNLALQHNDFLVDVFTNPIEALAKFKPGYYKIALIDLKMPEMGGIELFNKIREIDKKIKICFLTAYDWDNKQIKELSESFIQKPISIDGLVKIVKTEIEKEN